ncbi:MAG: cupin domain-containing protein [Clostridiaceae bacterium]
MIKKKNELKSESKCIREGKGQAKLEHIIEGEEFCGKGRLFAKMTIAPGNSVGYHKHVGDCEAYYILEGEGVLVENGEEKVIKKGEVTYCKEGDSHSIENASDKDLVFIALVLNA